MNFLNSVVYVITTTHTFIDLVIEKFRKSTSEEYWISNTAKRMYQAKNIFPNFHFGYSIFRVYAKLSFTIKTLFVKL